MSHTDKDLPYWVRVNDAHLPRYEHHYHSTHTRSRTRRRHKRNPDDTYAYTLKTEHVPVVKDNMDWYLKWQPDENWGYPIRHPRDRARFYRYEYRSHWEPVYEEYTVIYGADHCTIDEPRLGPSSRRYQPCTHELPHWVYSPYGGGPDQFQRQTFNSAARRRERDDLRAYVKEVNGSLNWSDLDDSKLAPDRHRHTIIWW